MGLFERLVLFSEVRGIESRDGRPVVGAELVQTVTDGKADVPTRRTVSEQGAFRFAPIESKAGWRRLVPAQPTMLQTIVIRAGGVDYLAWRQGKGSYDANSELGGQPLRLVCELAREPGHEGKHFGICRVDWRAVQSGDDTKDG